MKGYPKDVARLIWVRLVATDETPEMKYIPRWARIKKDKYPLLMAWANEIWFEVSFHYREVSLTKMRLVFDVESSEPIWLADLSVHPHPDTMYRLFENGPVLANPSLHDYTFDLEDLTPRRRYRRLRGSPKQDPKVNDGPLVGSRVTLGPLDALFLTKA